MRIVGISLFVILFITYINCTFGSRDDIIENLRKIVRIQSRQQPKNAPIKPTVFTEETFVTRLDHSRPQDTRKVDFNYKLNQFYYGPGGPLFLFISDGGSYPEYWIENGLMFDIGLPLNAVFVTFNQRYTGPNIPTETASFDDMQYLTVDNILADVATLIRHVKRELNFQPNQKVVVWGTGYSASLAAWARVKYPHLIDMAFSSSGYYSTEPVSSTFIDYTGFNFLMYGGGECYYRIRDIFNQIEDLIDTNQQEYLQESFNLCHPLNTTSGNTVAMFIEFQVNFIGDYIQENNIHGILDFCTATNTEDPLGAYIRWFQFNYGDLVECFDTDHDDVIEFLSDTNWYGEASIYGVRQALYLQCVEFGLLPVTSEFGIFPHRVPESFVIDICERTFGDDYTFSELQAAIHHLDVIHGELFVYTDKIVLSNSVLDPLHFKGVQFLRHPHLDSYVININYVSSSADLTSIQEWEIGTLTEAKRQISNIITNWVYQ